MQKSAPEWPLFLSLSIETLARIIARLHNEQIGQPEMIVAGA
jgi:hypothetical protein